jgi:cytidine deaminase
MEKEFTIRYKLIQEQHLAAVEQNLYDEAVAALEKSYSPYSNFKVACSILLENGAVVSGANQEVASYPVSLCAEGVALSAASSLHPGKGIQAMFIVTKNSTGIIRETVAPCGVCRQRIVEYETRQGKSISIYLLANTSNVVVFNSAKDLLPFAFDSHHLPIKNV